MHFDLDDTEQALAEGIRELCRGRVSMDRVRAVADTGGVDRDLFRELGEAGVFSLRVRESDGGLGLSATHAVVVFEELGRALVPGPLVDTHLAAGLIDGASDGTTVVAAQRGGTAPAGADVVIGVSDMGIHMIDRLPPVDPELVARPLDPCTPLRVVRGRGSTPLGDKRAASDWQRTATLLRAAQLVGIASATTEAATAYAKQRHQFGQPIGAFQAIKHLCADMLTRAEVARTAVHAAAVHVDGGATGDVARAVAGASLLAGRAALKNGKTNIQVHGGMGFTWEVDAHLFLKRAAVLCAADPSSVQADRIAATL